MTTLYAKNASTAQQPGSTTKLMTALVTRQRVSDALLDNTVTVTVGDTVDWATNSNAGLTTGDVISYRDLLYGLMLPSGNDAAKCLARNVGQIILTAEGGSGDPSARFLTEMNNQATSLGMSASTFYDPAGTDYRTAMSALDLAKVLEAFGNQALLVTVSGTLSRTLTITGANARTYSVANHIDPNGTVKLPEFICGKIGNVTFSSGFEQYNSGFCLALMWALPTGERRSCVVMGSTTNLDRFLDCRHLMDSELARVAQPVLNQTLAGISQTASAVLVSRSFAAVQALASVSQAAAATAVAVASASQSLPGVVQVATATAAARAVAAQSLEGVAQLASASTTVGPKFAAAQTLDGVSGAGTVAVQTSASAAQVFGSVVQVTTAQSISRASGAQLLEGVAQSALGSTPASLASSQALGGVLQAASGTVGDTIRLLVGTQALAGVTQHATARHAYIFARNERTRVIAAEQRRARIAGEQRRAAFSD